MTPYYIITLVSLYALSYIIGLFVIHKGLRVNYARKILSICFFLFTAYILTIHDRAEGLFGLILGMAISLIWVLSFLHPFRSRSKFLTICFASFDRPEDRPFTIVWLSTAMVVGYWVLVGIIEWLKYYNAVDLIFITVFISTFGDGLAEPIGIRYGQHSYKTRALFTKKTYIRTWEGSACVFLSGISIIIAMMDWMTFPQFVAMLCLMPIAMTITEAKSPHTWDNPFMHLVGGLITVGIVHFI